MAAMSSSVGPVVAEAFKQAKEDCKLNCPPPDVFAARVCRQGLTLVHFSAQPKPFWSHLPVSPCLIDRVKLMHPTYPTKFAYLR